MLYYVAPHHLLTPVKLNRITNDKIAEFLRLEIVLINKTIKDFALSNSYLINYLTTNLSLVKRFLPLNNKRFNKLYAQPLTNYLTQLIQSII